MKSEVEYQEQEEEVQVHEDVEEEEEGEETQVSQLFATLTEEVEKNNPDNVIYFIIDFLCKWYPNHVHGLASVFNGDPALEYEKMAVMEFMKSQKISGEIAGHFISSGFDTLETMETVTMEVMDQVEKDNNAKWLTGHKVRMQQVFADAPAKIKAFKDEKEAAVKTFMSFQMGAQPNMNMSVQPSTTTVYMTQQAPVYPAGSFKTQFTPSNYVRPMMK